MAGNGTIGLEILEDLPDPDAVVIPYGGGGLTVGHRERDAGAATPDEGLHGGARDRRGAGRRARGRRAGRRRLQRRRSSTASGSRRVLDPMWPRVRELVDDAFAGPDRRTPPARCGCSPSART